MQEKEFMSPSKILEFINRRCDADTAAEVRAWITRSDENRAEYLRLKQLCALKEVHRHSGRLVVEGALRRFHTEIAQRRRVDRLRRWAYAASSVAVLLAVGLFIIGVELYSERFEWHTVTNTATDEVVRFTLNDGTKVFLRRGAELSFRENFLRQRNVRLRGEAFFDVVSDSIRPFVVQTPDLHIRVLGTSFDVIAGDTTVAILERGRIALETTSGRELASMLPGQRAVVDGASGRLLSLEQVQTGKYTSWRFNHKVYDRISFAEIVRLIEERHGVSVIYDPAAFENTAYRLVINDDETLEQMLEILNLISPVEYTIQGKRIILKKRKPIGYYP